MVKTLTIGIPVLNEIKHLEKTVDNLVYLAGNVDFEIELIIVDNFSTDGTRLFLQSLPNKVSNLDLKVHFNSKNEGFNYSCDTIIDYAEGKYLWIIGGHDLINMQAMHAIRDILAYDPDYVICNATIRDESSNQVINESLWQQISSEDFTTLERFFDKWVVLVKRFHVTSIKQVRLRNTPQQCR